MSSAREYPSPPVHEVILSLLFHEPIDAERLEQLPALLADRFPSPERLDLTEAQVVVSATGEAATRMTKQFDAWRFKDEGPTRVVQAGRSQVSLHAVRPGKWPGGTYPGWRSTSTWTFEVLVTLTPLYQGQRLKRAGLRYLNRIAIPASSGLAEWFMLLPRGPDFLRRLFTFNFTQTWAEVDGHEDLSATVRLAKIEIEDPKIAKDHQGALLDIEVFNLWVERAPDLDQLATWFDRAHDVENRIFESYITDALRDRFERRE